MSIGLGLEKKSEAKEREQKHLVEPLVSSDEAVPHEYLCSITSELMTDPVVAADGHTYERKAITEWFEKKLTSPLTGKPLESANLVPNHNLRKVIQEFTANRKTLQARYRQTQLAQSTLQLLVGGRHLPLQQSFINLALLHQTDAKEQAQKPSDKEAKDNPADEKATATPAAQKPAEARSEWLAAYETLQTKATPINLNDLFTPCTDPNKQQVLVLGRAGVGKSTLCRYIAHEWAARRLWADRFQWVFRIPLRHLNSDRYPAAQTREADLLRKECLADLTKEDASDILDNEGNILWLLDGYDEMPQPLPRGLQALWERLKNKPHVIMTSRPQAIAEHVWPVRLEISGFTEENVTAYIAQFFKQTIPPRPELATSLQQLLINNENLGSISRIPIQLEILCSLWESESETFKTNTNELTLSQLYQRLILLLLKRQVNKDASNILAEPSLLRRYRDELTALDQLAFTMMQHQQVVLSGEKLTQLLTRFSENDPYFIDCLMQLGFLKYFEVYTKSNQVEAMPLAAPESASVAMDLSDSSGKDEKGSKSPTKRQDYYFIHLTFQEYFAARHLVACLQEPLSSQNYQSAFQFINQHKYDCHYKILLGFVAGLLSQQSGEKATPALKSFWQAIDDEPREWFGARHLELMTHCLNESVLDKRIPNYEDRLKSLHAFIERQILTAEAQKLLLLLATHRRVFRVLIKLVGGKMLSKHFGNKYYFQVLQAVGLCLQPGHHQAAWKAWKARLERYCWSSQPVEEAFEALQTLGPQLWRHQIAWEAVLKGLGSEDERIREAAVRVLQASSPRLWEHQTTWEAMLKGLGSENEKMREVAFRVLQASGPRLWEHQIAWETVLKCWEDKNEEVRKMAIRMLQMASPQLWKHKSVLGTVLKRLEDNDEKVRYASLKILQAAGVQLLEQPAIWKAVQKRLIDKAWEIQKAALEIVEMLAPRLWKWKHQATYDTVLKWLASNNGGVNEAANKLVQALGPRLWEYQPIWEAVLKRLENENEYGLKDTLIALQASGPKLWEHQSVWKAVLKLLEYDGSDFPELGYSGSLAVTTLRILRASGPQLWEHQSVWEAVLKWLLQERLVNVSQAAFEVFQASGPKLWQHKSVSEAMLDASSDHRVISSFWEHQHARETVLKRLEEHKEYQKREVALRVLKESGLQVWEHQPVWKAVLKCLENERLCISALDVLQASGPRLWEHPSVVTVLLKCLEDNDWQVREAALKVFQASGPRLWEHPSVVAVLLKCLEDNDWKVCKAALKVFQASGPRLWEHQLALETTLKNLEYDDWQGQSRRSQSLEVLQAIPLLPAFNYLTRPDNPIDVAILAKVANLQNVSFYVANKALWLVDQKGTTRVDLPWDQVQGQLQKLLAACQQLAHEQGLSDFINSATVKKPEVAEGLGLSAGSAAMDLSDEKPKEAQQESKPPHHPADAKQNTNSFFAEDSRKRRREVEPAASASASSSSNPNAATSLPSASAQTHTPMETDDEQSVSATSNSSAAAANESGEPAAKKARREGPKP